MKAEEDETTTLLRKVEQQDELIQKLRNEENKLTNYVKQFKETLDKKVNKDPQGLTKPVVDEEKLEKQMEKQL